MFNDIFKIIKKCLKFWYVFIITLLIGLLSIYFFFKPIRTYNSSFSLKSEFLNRKLLWDEFYSWDAYDDNRKVVLTTVSDNYLKERNEEIRKDLSLVEQNHYSIKVSVLGDYSGLSVVVQSGDAATCEKVIDYIYSDIVIYLEDIINKNVSGKYRIPTENELSRPKDASLSINNKKTKLGLTVLISTLMAEVVFIALIALNKKKIESDIEVESICDTKIIVKDYDKNLKAFETILKKNKQFRKNVLLISEDLNYVSQRIKAEQVRYKELHTLSSVEDFYDIEETSFIIEIIKFKTPKKNVINLINILNMLNITDICVITRKEINTNENSSNK